jgi:hypothetical protein
VTVERRLAAAERRRAARARRMLAAQQAMSAHLAELPSPPDLFRRVLATVCDTLDWGFGAVWQPNRDGTALRCSALWHRPGDHIAGFRAATTGQVFGRGEDGASHGVPALELLSGPGFRGTSAEAPKTLSSGGQISCASPRRSRGVGGLNEDPIAGAPQ